MRLDLVKTPSGRVAHVFVWEGAALCGDYDSLVRIPRALPLCGHCLTELRHGRYPVRARAPEVLAPEETTL